MDRKTQGLVLAGVGVLVVLASLFAAPLGLAKWSGFGSNQWTGTLIGAVVLVIGLVLAKSRKAG